MNEYAKRHGFLGPGFDYLVAMTRAMDDAFLKHMAEKDKDDTEDA